MQAYDVARFDPAAPLALVTVKSEQLGIVIHDVPMLLDTGADVSLLTRTWRRWHRLTPSNTSWKHSTEQKAPRWRSSRSCNCSADRSAVSSCWLKVGTAFWVATY